MSGNNTLTLPRNKCAELNVKSYFLVSVEHL